MEIRLALNTGFLVNRYVTPEQWIPFVSQNLDIKRIQFTADMLNPGMPASIVKNIARRTKNLADDNGLTIDSTFTGAFTRLNHFGHPEAKIRGYWIKWFKRFVDLSVMLGAKSMGSHFGIVSVPDYENMERRRLRFLENVECWRKIAAYGRKCGLEFLTWEPMSIGREYGETIEEVKKIQMALNQHFDIPMLLCLDVDHGDVDSPDPKDVDPYAYISAFGRYSPQIHIKQSYKDKGGHWPFTKDHNEKGKIIPEEIINALKSAGVEKVTLILELSFRERSPDEKRLVSDVRESVDFWKPYCLL
ncbi:TIM barrel protein [Candidatus Gottesmanbacteria bacterium]|nr:TIM barrel protein [Candidatus Gottesmanbacteria bacterium]